MQGSHGSLTVRCEGASALVESGKKGKYVLFLVKHCLFGISVLADAVRIDVLFSALMWLTH